MNDHQNDTPPHYLFLLVLFAGAFGGGRLGKAIALTLCCANTLSLSCLSLAACTCCTSSLL